MTDADLLKEIEAQRLLMISVSTGQASIASKNNEYIELRDRIRAELRHRGLPDALTLGGCGVYSRGLRRERRASQFQRPASVGFFCHGRDLADLRGSRPATYTVAAR
jgi:hypothetical protein